MQINYPNITNNSSSQPSQQSSTNREHQSIPMYNKIIASTQQIINDQAIKIYQQTKQIATLNKNLKQLQRKYQLCLQIATQTNIQQNIENSNILHNEPKQPQTKIIIDKLMNKICQLQQEITHTKIQIAELKSSKLQKQYQQIKRQKGNQENKLKNFKSKKSVPYFDVDDLKEKYFKGKFKISNMSLLVLGSKIYKTNHNKYQSKFKQKTQQFAKRGIPKFMKPLIWPIIFDNPLGLTISVYTELLQYQKNLPEPKKVKQQIDKDISRSFHSRTEFESKVGLRDEIHQILQIFHIYRPDISYIQGMTYPVIILDLLVGKYRAFIIFANLIIGNNFFRRLFTFQGNYVSIYCRIFQALLKQNLPQLYNELVLDKKIQAEIYLIQWFYTFFSRGLSYEITLRIWDILAYEGQLILYKLALSIFMQINDQIITSSYQTTITTILQYHSYIKCTQKKLLDRAINLRLTPDRFSRLFEKVSKQLKQLQK